MRGLGIFWTCVKVGRHRTNRLTDKVFDSGVKSRPRAGDMIDTLIKLLQLLRSDSTARVFYCLVPCCVEAISLVLETFQRGCPSVPPKPERLQGISHARTDGDKIVAAWPFGLIDIAISKPTDRWGVVQTGAASRTTPGSGARSEASGLCLKRFPPFERDK